MGIHQSTVNSWSPRCHYPNKTNTNPVCLYSGHISFVYWIIVLANGWFGHLRLLIIRRYIWGSICYSSTSISCHVTLQKVVQVYTIGALGRHFCQTRFHLLNWSERVTQAVHLKDVLEYMKNKCSLTNSVAPWSSLLCAVLWDPFN